MFGWHKYIKGVDIACQSLNCLPENLKGRCKLCIVASHRDDDLDYVKKHCDNPENVYYLQSVDDIFLYHTSSDILLSSSRSEGFSYAIMEALAVGTPAVISDIPGTKWATKYDNVYSFESQNPQALAVAIEKCIENNNEELNALVSKQVIADHDINKWCEAVFNVLNSNKKLKK